MTPSEPRQPWDQSRLERGRALTREEIDQYLADRQTALRHATARIGDEIAEQLRDELRKLERLTVVERLTQVADELDRTNDGELRRAAAVVDGARVLVDVWATTRGV